MDDEPSTAELSRRQLEQAMAERERLEQAENEAEAARHQRRADKADYLREKLAEQQRADAEAGADDEPPLLG
jgi:hypothetical protein